MEHANKKKDMTNKKNDIVCLRNIWINTLHKGDNSNNNNNNTK
jgi:hypothetical protein